MPTANDDYRDALVRHQAGLLRFGSTTANKVVDLLEKTETDVRREIQRRTKGMAQRGSGIKFTRFQRQRLAALERSLKEVRGEAMRDAKRVLREDMIALTESETAFVLGAVETVSPVVLDLARPAKADLAALVTHNPFEGRVLSDWVDGLAEADTRRMLQQIRIGVAQGDGIQRIEQRVLGSLATGTKGAVERTADDLTTIVRTAVISFSNQAKQAAYQANSDILEGEVFHATLDARTTIICASLDGRRFRVGEGPIPPLHPNCRSVRIAVLDDEFLGSRPMKPVTQKQLLREFADERGIKRVATRKGLPHGFKGDFDAFARKRVRELVGRVPAETSFPDWLARQSVEFQDDYLGKAKGRIFRQGGMEPREALRTFLDASGREMSLAELAQADRAAFASAGLEPSAFLN